MTMQPLGKTGPKVSRLGLGCMGMSGVYGPADRAESIATIHAALDSGINLIDTGDFYGSGHNELLIAEALKDRPRDSYQLSVKFGALFGIDRRWHGNDSRPKAIHAFIAYSLQRLGTDYIDIYRPSRLDVDVPIEETMGALADLVQAGLIRHVGLSEVGAATLRRAAAVHPVCDLQIEYSLISRGIEESILPTARELGIGITAYGVLSRGLFGGNVSKDGLPKSDARAMTPRFQGNNLDANLKLVEALRALADAKGVTVAQISIAWVLNQGDDVVPIIGARRRAQLSDAIDAQKISLSSEDLAAIERAVPKGAGAGGRYPDAQLSNLDSEVVASGN